MRYRPTEAPDLPIEQVKPFFNEAMQDVFYYIKQLWAGWPVKGAVSAVLGTVSTFYTDVFFGNWFLFCLWAGFITVDLFFGLAVALQAHKFTMSRLYKFMVKASTHMFIIAMMGFLNHSFSTACGRALPLADWFMCMMLCTEALSILLNMDKLGLPVPKVAHKIIAKMDKSANQKINEVLGTEDDKQD